MNNFQIVNCYKSVMYEAGARGFKKVRGYVAPHGLFLSRSSDVGFIDILGNGKYHEYHVFLRRNASSLGYVRNLHSHLNNGYKKEFTK